MSNTLHMISGPRNMSTAILYAFAQHPDLKVIDEPFYGYYLHQTGKVHPGNDLVFKHMPTNLSQILPKLTPEDDWLFVKNMAHHIADMGSYDWIKTHHIIHIIRHPAQMLHSFQKVIPNPTLKDLGLKDQYHLYLKFQRLNLPQLIIDSAEILNNPEEGLSKMCTFAGLKFDSKMLSWPSGPKPYDGVWAPWWYSGVHNSTCFKPQKTTTTEIFSHFSGVYEEGMHYYNLLTQNK